jgi:uncharacterized Fe-S cluster-containing radical SAM superfamily enzyme
MPKLIGFARGKYYLYLDDIPLVGHIAFGVIDRCTNVLQIRPITVCPYNCIYCSVDAGPFSRHRLSEFIVDSKLLVKWVKHVYESKNGEVLEGLIDGVGEPPLHPDIVEIVRELKKFLPRVAMETRGYTLTKKLVDQLAEAGLDRLNISIDTLRIDKGKILQGVEWYNVEYVKNLVEYIVKETTIDVHLTPVWLPGLNDEDIEEIIEWGLKIGVGKKYPPFGIQKYEIHKYGRKVSSVKYVSWEVFKKFLTELENKYGIPLYYKNINFEIKKSRCYYNPFKKGAQTTVVLVSPGWLKNEILAIDKENMYTLTVIGLEWNSSLAGKNLKVRLIEVYDTICIAKTS